MIDFKTRSQVREWMDDLSFDDPSIPETLHDLAIVNERLNGYAPTLNGIEKLLPRHCDSFTLLDVGTGGGDTARKIAESMNGRKVNVKGIDINPEIVKYASEKCADDRSIEISLQNLFTCQGNEDIVHAALVLHHFNETEIVPALKKMHEISRYGIVINDLHRHWAAYFGIKVLSIFFAKSKMFRHDAPLSVLRGFIRSELERLMKKAGFLRYEIRWFWAFRWQIVIWK